MLKAIYGIFLVLLCTLAVLSINAVAEPNNSEELYKTNQPIETDRWLEIDLYWFDLNNMEKSVDTFWDRYFPLFENVQNWKGVILNVGWLMDTVYEWQGDADKQIALPKNMRHWPFIKAEGQLTGTTEERIKLWNHRFEISGDYEVVNYEPWTYADLKTLASLLKQTAEKKYNLKDIKVGILALGWQSIYDGELSAFSKTHENAFIKAGIKWNVPNMIAKLKADPRKYGAYPNGIPEGTPLVEFFGRQWGDMSKEIGLDAIILRDSIMGVGVYARTGPYGRTAPKDPVKVAEWSRATADIVRYCKQSNPDALVIGYSSAASAVADWRVNCFDLEAIAKEGYLDAWIDQTWAGAWNEAGQRPTGGTRFWNSPRLGWTYQLAYMLGHAAILADSNVRHYFLTETFDAWESWDIIHTAQDRLRWGIWAYSHAAVKMPSGLKMPAGSYISWCNQGKKLLSEEDVAFLAKHSNEAILDAAKTTEVFGPTLVYNRSAMKWQSENAPDIMIKEWIDEQAGTVMKWSVPILSVTRSEYLPNVESDLFVFQTPVHMTQEEKQNVLAVLKSGRPAAVFASPAGGLEPEIADLIGISTKDKSHTRVSNIATINCHVEGIFEGLPNTFAIYHFFTKNELTQKLEPIYTVENSPALILNTLEGKQLLFWDPAELAPNVPASTGGSLDQVLGSPVPYVLTARSLNEMSRNNKLAYVDEINTYKPVFLAYWQTNGGIYNILAGNLEEGINHTADKSVSAVFNLPMIADKNDVFIADEIFKGGKYVIGNGKIRVVLDGAETKLYKIDPASE